MKVNKHALNFYMDWTLQVDDVKMEYRLKYENMFNIYMQLQSEMVESQKIAETHIKGNNDLFLFGHLIS